MKMASITLTCSLVCTGLLFGTFGLATPAQAQVAPKKVLVVTTTLGFRHSSIPTAEKVTAELGTKSSVYAVEYARVDPTDPQYRGDNGRTDNAKVNAAIKAILTEKMSPEALKTYDLIIFANTTGDLPVPDRQAFLDWIRSGKGFVGMHSATDTFHGFPGYLEMIGAEFQNHAAQLEITPKQPDDQCPACAHLGKDWKVYDEIYQFKNFDSSKFHTLLTLDKRPDVRNPTPGEYPVSWCKEYGKGRVFYTSLGHREDLWDPNWTQGGRRNSTEVAEAYQKHILEGIKWAMGMGTWNLSPTKRVE
jgi:uncharacterized protein